MVSTEDLITDPLPGYMPTDVAVPTEPAWEYNTNIAIQVFAILLYSVLLIYVLHNTYVYLWLKKKYEVLTHTVFYFFAIMLASCRIVQHSMSFNWLMNYRLRLLNSLNDGFSVCIGISQVVVVAEIVLAMELFKLEIDTMDQATLQISVDEKESKVKLAKIIAILSMCLTAAELVVRAIVRDYFIGNIIFVSELFLVASFMLYYTMKFSKLVNEVQKTLGVDFMDEKNQLRCSLGVFLFTYFLRSVIKGLTLALQGVYGTLWSEPVIAESLVCLVQFVYDIWPLLTIAHQHHSAFKEQNRVTKTTIQTVDEGTREYTQLRNFSHDQSMVTSQ